MQGTPGGEALARVNALYPGFGPSGTWLMQPKQANKTTAAAAAKGKLDVQQLMTQLWASVALRDNIVTVFGYVLSLPASPLSAELYTSLFHVFDAVRLRRVATFELIRAVRELAGAGPAGQFLALFRAMRLVAPRYLQSAVSVWVDACRKRPDFLDGVLRPGGGPLVVDFLAGIDASLLDQLAEELQWPHAAAKNGSAAKDLFGADIFENVFTALREGTLELTQSLFALLLVNRPTNDVAAEKDETERYFVDVLRLGNVENWSGIVKEITKEDQQDPDTLIKKVLKLVSESEQNELSLREDARYLRLYLRKPSVTYANKHYEDLSGIISKPSIDILSLLKSITPKEYPFEIVKARNRIVEYILDGQLNMEFIVKGFNRFDHVTPMNILIALLTRIDKRVPQLPKHVSQSVKMLQVFLLYKKVQCSMSSTVPVNLLDASVVASAYADSSVPSNVTDLFAELAKTLSEENVSWDEVARNISVHRCSRPRQCIYNFLCFILRQKYLPKGRSTVIIKELLKLLDRDGNPITRQPLLSQVRPQDDQEVSITALETRPPLVTTLQPPKEANAAATLLDTGAGAGATLAPWRRAPQASDARFLREVATAARRAQALPFPALSAVQQEEPASLKYPATCLPRTADDSQEHAKILPAQMLLSWARLPQLIGDFTRLSPNIKKGELLVTLMEKISQLEVIKRVEDVYKYVQSFLQFISSFRQTLSADSVVHFPSLLNALPVVKSDTERQYVAKLKNYFSRPEFYKQLGARFNPRLHKTRGQMLKYVLGLMNSLPPVKWDPILRKAIDYYVGKVYTNGYGAQEVEWALVSESAEPTYVDMTVFRALDHSKMTQDALLAEYEIIRFIFTEFIPNVHLRDFDVKEYKTKGQFLKGTFQYLLQQDSVKPKIKDDIRMLMKFIRMDGRGSEPLDYNADSTH
ncbi:uncharacterized protein GBIM_07770 [Gryllus bimaculatus]|nr:uncharacterized protein GBIM_07770 [Gryllus bimaculatus]